MKLEPLKITGPDVLIPGSDFLLAGIGRLLVIVGVFGMVIGLAIRWYRRRKTVDATAQKRPRAVISFAIATLVGVVLSVMFWPPAFEAPILPALPRLLPEQAFVYRDVTDVPVRPESQSWIAALGTIPVTPSFGSKIYMGHSPGVPFNPVTSKTRRIDVHITQWKKNSYPGPFPIADPPYIENFPLYGGDQHYLAIDVDARRAWELIALRSWFGRWEADSGASWSMDDLTYPHGSTIAARMPLLPGAVTFDDVASGSVDHAIFASSRISARGRWIWPARGADGVSDDPSAPPMGAWLRLKADADLSKLGPQAKIIAKAAQTYGVIISDTGPKFGLRGTADRRWDSNDVKSLSTLTTDDFEVIDSESFMVSADSMAAKPAAKPAG